MTYRLSHRADLDSQRVFIQCLFRGIYYKVRAFSKVRHAISLQSMQLFFLVLRGDRPGAFSERVGEKYIMFLCSTLLFSMSFVEYRRIV